MRNYNYMTKQEKIKEVYQHLYDKNKICDDGWYNNSDEKIKFHHSEFLGEMDYKNNFWFRPKSLQGIENNNGWIKIESENMILPIDGTEVHFYHSFTNENGVQTEYHKGIFNAALGFTSYYDSENYKINEVTHYQLIVEQKPPLY